MTLLDLRAAVTELRAKLTGLRLANVYDVNSRTYLLKFSQPGKKFVLLLESGTRVHTTQFTRDKSTIPSGFAMKVRQSSQTLAPASILLTSVPSLAGVQLRKHIRTRRLEGIEQLGADRVLKLTFGSGEAQYHLICELYDRVRTVGRRLASTDDRAYHRCRQR